MLLHITLQILFSLLCMLVFSVTVCLQVQLKSPGRWQKEKNLSLG